MKTLTTLTIAAALAASMSVAGAQSSMQKPSAMDQKTDARVIGNEPFCAKPRTGADSLNCEYATRADCVQKVGQAGSALCVPNPGLGTTGAGSEMK